MMRNGALRSSIAKVEFATTATMMLASSRSPPCVRFLSMRCAASHLNDHYAALGLTPFASKSDVKHAYKRLALKHHPDVSRAGNVGEKGKTFREIKLAYERLMQKFEEDEELQAMKGDDEYDEWEEWMGFEGGIPGTVNLV